MSEPTPNEAIVLNWIESHFDTSEVTIEKFPALPSGYRIIDQEGEEMVVFYDFFTNEVKQMFPNK